MKAALYSLAAFSAAPGAAEARQPTWDLAGEVVLVSRYVDEDGSVYTPGPALQPELVLTHTRSGCYASLWASIGVSQSAGDEVDVLVGCEVGLGDGTNFDIAGGQYRFRGGSWWVLTGGISRGGVSLRGHYYSPTTSERPGVRFVAAYEQEWDQLSLSGSLVYDSGSHNGLADMVGFTLGAERRLNSIVSVMVVAQAPISQARADARGAQAWGGLSVRFRH